MRRVVNDSHLAVSVLRLINAAGGARANTDAIAEYMRTADALAIVEAALPAHAICDFERAVGSHDAVVMCTGKV